MKIADLMIKISGDHVEFTKMVKNVQRDMNRLSGDLTKVGKTMTVGITAPLIALGVQAIKTADAQLKAEAKVQQAITSTGGAAKLSLKELDDYATELENTTLFDGDRILNDASAQLLTFTNIVGKNFLRAQASALDLTTVLDGDLKSASIQLGKALNDPVKNLSALSRSGIQFSKEQTEVIKQLAETNRVAEAQSIILDELERQYGGQAEAAKIAGTGGIKTLSDSFGVLLEQIGERLLGPLQKVTEWLNNIVEKMKELKPETLDTILVFAGLAAATGPLLLALGGIVKLIPLIAVGFAAIVSPISLVVAALVGLGSAFFYVSQQKDKLFDGLTEKFSGLTTGTLNSMLAENKRRQAVNENNDWKIDGPRKFLSNISYSLGKGDRRRELELEEKAILSVMEAREQAAEQEKKLEEQTRKITDKINKGLNEIINPSIEVTTGLIGTLQAQITELEAKLPFAKTRKEVAVLNIELERLKAKLAELNALRSKPTTNHAPVGITNSTLNSQFSVAPTIDRDRLVKLPISESDKLFEGFLATANASLARLKVDLEHSLQDFLSTGLSVTGEGIGEMLYNAVSGKKSSTDILGSLKHLFADILSQVGKLCIEFGIAMIGFAEVFKKLMANITNPVAAIAIVTVGAALLITAGALRASINDVGDDVPALAKGGLAYGPTYAMVGDNPNARIDPEVIAPLSKLRDMMGANINQINITGELKVRGSDLSLVISRHTKTLKFSK